MKRRSPLSRSIGGGGIVNGCALAARRHRTFGGAAFGGGARLGGARDDAAEGDVAQSEAPPLRAEPHPTHKLRNASHEGPDKYRVSWYDFRRAGHPALRFYRWAIRHSRHLPEERRPYYLHLLRQETKAGSMLNITWDVIVAVAAGYSKVRWILEKYNIPFAPIPPPFDDFWSEEYFQERRAAYSRSVVMKELQAMERPVAASATASLHVRNTASRSTLARAAGGKGTGCDVHADDLPAPTEDDMRNSKLQLIISDISGYEENERDFIVTAHEMRMKHREKNSNDELFAFEDEDEDFVPKPRKSPVM